jgi:hypothetical protein
VDQSRRKCPHLHGSVHIDYVVFCFDLAIGRQRRDIAEAENRFSGKVLDHLLHLARYDARWP